MFAATAAIMTSAGLPPPTITGITPTSFYTSRWVGFTVTGTNFLAGQTSASSALGTGGIYVTGVNTAGTSVTLNIYSHYAGTAPVYISTPFGTAATQNITASVEPPPMSVSSVVNQGSYLDVYGSGFTYNTGAYVSGYGWRPVGFMGTTYLYILHKNGGGPDHGNFFLYDSTTGSGTGWVSF